MDFTFIALSDAIQAAILQVKLRHVDAWSDARAARAATYDRLLREVPGAFALEPAGDMLDSLSLVSRCRLVITVDTSWAHLAGAAGVPCFLLLSHSGVDWRWFPKGPTSPWYPSMRLFWQTFPGDWDGVMSQVRGALDVA